MATPRLLAVLIPAASSGRRPQDLVPVSVVVSTLPARRSIVLQNPRMCRLAGRRGWFEAVVVTSAVVCGFAAALFVQW